MADVQRPKENARGWLLPRLAKLRWPLVRQMHQALGSSCISCNYIIPDRIGKPDILFWYCTVTLRTCDLVWYEPARYAIDDGRQLFWTHHLFRDPISNLYNANKF
jgi:hypothetical protein